jgi:hypothetical protein
MQYQKYPNKIFIFNLMMNKKCKKKKRKKRIPVSIFEAKANPNRGRDLI